MDEQLLERRHLLGLSLALGAAATAASCGATGRAPEGGAGEEDVGPAEDLMREHGVLNRILLVYEECENRLGLGRVGHEGIPTGLLADAAGLVQRFVHDYHEKLEEREVFPRLERAGKVVDVVKILREQHAAGQRVTTRILALGAGDGPASDPDRGELASRLGDFIRMYRPHAAREDTIVFPAFHAMFSPKEWDELGDLFEGQEHKVLGDEGFEHAVERVAEFERALGIHDLARFTPRV
jgi:hemerythrin-like domain-containing protein